MSPWNVDYLQQEIMQESLRLRRRFKGLATLSASHELYTQEFKQLDLYYYRLVEVIGERRAAEVMCDISMGSEAFKGRLLLRVRIRNILKNLGRSIQHFLRYIGKSYKAFPADRRAR